MLSAIPLRIFLVQAENKDADFVRVVGIQRLDHNSGPPADHRLLGIAALRNQVGGNFCSLFVSRPTKFATQAKSDFAANHRSQFEWCCRFRQ
jgi:hypothetical protein